MNKKEIEGFDNYFVTPEGLILNGDRPLKIQINKSGTPFVRLRRKGEYFAFTIAKLVALTFLKDEIKSPSDVICYKDGNNHNYDINNLYWSTRSEAYTKLYKENSRYSAMRLENLRKKLCKPIAAYKETSEGIIHVKTYNSITEAANEIGVASASIIRCLKDNDKHCMGLLWRYMDKEI